MNNFMKSCVVHNCGSNSMKRPELCFFSLPRIKSVREEWLEKLGPRVSLTHFVYVCELHFRIKDFRIGAKKELKSHAVPVLQLGTGSNDPVDSEDEFIQDSQIESKTEPKLVNIKEEPLSDEESNLKLSPSVTSGRRPSRRAAIVAAQKIRNCTPAVPERPTSYGKIGTIVRTSVAVPTLKNFSPPLPSTPAAPPPPLPPAALADISLDMECYEEALSETQTEILSEAQNQYNLVMKGLKELVQCSGKMVQTDASGTMILNTLPFPFQTTPSIPPTINPLQPNTVFIKADNSKMIPISLAAGTKPSYIFM